MHLFRKPRLKLRRRKGNWPVASMRIGDNVKASTAFKSKSEGPNSPIMGSSGSALTCGSGIVIRGAGIYFGGTFDCCTISMSASGGPCGG